MEHLYKVNEIFKSIDGEGVRTGLPVIFIRLHGCNLRCKYCDTRYACEQEEFTLMTREQIVNRCLELGGSRITLTGGEPLLDPEINELVLALRYREFEINIETNGSVDISSICWITDIITMDYKCSCSGMEHLMKTENIRYLDKGDVLKFVVGSIEDLDRMKEIIRLFRPRCRVYVSPVFGAIEPAQLVEYVLENNLDDVTVQVQLHKIIWNPNMRGV